MSVQTTYNFSTTIGEAGGIIDLAPYVIDSFTNENESGMAFGIGVITGEKPGKTVKVPDSGAVAGKFEGVVTNRRTTEYDLDGKVVIKKNATVGVMRYGRIYVRVADSVTPAYGDAVYMLKSGVQAGYFTNEASENVAVKGRFLGPVDATNHIAAVELFNAAN